MIIFNHKTSLNSLEDAYEKLGADNSVDIKISKSFSNDDFGLTPAIIQFFATWYHSNSGKIIFDIKTEDVSNVNSELSDKYLSDFYRLDFLFTCVVYCWIRPIEDIEGRNIKPLLRLQNESHHRKMRRQQINGFQAILACFDHLGNQKGLLNAFYTDDEFIDNEIDFDRAIDKSLRQVTSLNVQLQLSNFAPVRQDVIDVIFELVKNTNDWARADINERPLTPNSRGLYLKTHRRTKASFLDIYHEYAGLNGFFTSNYFETNSNNELYFLEISVFDTGVGYVNRFTKRPTNDFSTEEQVEVIKECMLVNNTSATGLTGKSKGKGLDRIMRTLNDKGFFWLRTGNVSVFRNLIQNHYKPDGLVTDIQLYDWRENSNDRFTPLFLVKGTVATLIFPLMRRSNV
ncbi:hypothetical protein [Mucilaginibacter ginkgonis]|uniref:Uncharacterized protein n=1 Tax=Mucilaginibacter ginkgonis TaxID=2682091 RepID=A0A6I4HXW1_9SPHI|nr:hypothetical protein [Mucilaginibacter ginkgonis]QQL51212.1 hypothetical protein GO620_007120 [Mucilaginibacter ginkgonis]